MDGFLGTQFQETKKPSYQAALFPLYYVHVLLADFGLWEMCAPKISPNRGLGLS
jgi:hypothetical protein